MLTNCPVSCAAAIGELGVSMASFISLLILNKAKSQTGTHWPQAAQTSQLQTKPLTSWEVRLFAQCFKSKSSGGAGTLAMGSTVIQILIKDDILKTYYRKSMISLRTQLGLSKYRRVRDGIHRCLEYSRGHGLDMH